MDALLKHMDYVVIVVLAILLYRVLGEPLAFKV